MMRFALIMSVLGATLLSAAAQGEAAERAPVYAGVTAPHSYYWREMLIPQLTSGPSSLAWSPDGKSLYFSMQGRIWRQSLSQTRAVEITAGAGYDYEPDVSPDGKTLVFARRLDDAINLVALDLKSGRETALTDGGALNFAPRWSPDGAAIAFVTTGESGNFHIAIARRAGDGWRATRWRKPTASGEGRYYYSKEDHELSPAWSPDGATLIFVSNEGVRHGTGRIVSQTLDLSSPPTIIRDEETNWKARPEFSPDGRRVLYSSYYGRQWHQLWLTTAAPGGFPLAASFGEFDAVGARWSPDGGKIAFISNEAGGLRIEILDVVGGARRVLEQKTMARKTAAATLALKIRDAAGEALAARVAIRGADGRDYAPSGALIHADDYRDPARGMETHYFHTDGDDEISLPPGKAEIRLWRGLETRPVSLEITLAKGANEQEISLDRIDGDFSGFVSGDVHVHMNYGGAYHIAPEGLARQADAEALDLAFNLIVNKEQRIPDIAAFSATPTRPAGARAVVSTSQEFHTSIWGHMGLLGLADHILLPDYVGYPETALASLYPDNATVAGLARAQGALAGYVHPYDPPAPDPSAPGRFSHSLPADVALGRVDYLEVIGFSDHKVTEAVWHRLLNCGFRLPAAGGTDAMTNYASLRGPIGLDRTYADLRNADAGAGAPNDPAARTRDWLAALKAGRSFATNSALLSLSVDGKAPGDDINLSKAGAAPFEARMASIAKIDRLEIIVNGKIAQTLALSGDGVSAHVTGELQLEKSGWISLRAVGAPSSDVFDLYPYAVTSPIYVTVGGKPARSRADADYFIAWIDRLIDHAQNGDFNSEDERKIVVDNFRKARKVFESRR